MLKGVKTVEEDKDVEVSGKSLIQKKSKKSEGKSFGNNKKN